MNHHAQPASPRSGRPRRALAALLAFGAAAAAHLAAPTSALVAQQPPAAAAAPRADSSAKSAARVELERKAASLEAAGKASDAAALRRRLTEGDFAVGDRIALTVTGPLTVDDTLPIRAGQVITVATLPDISLRGVLRSELNDYLTRQISRYVRDPVVHSSALVRVTVSGAVTRPGFYAVPADIQIGDAIMHAGGLTSEADLKRTVVKRGSSETLSRDAVQRAVRDGSTLDQVGLRAGDEIVVGKKRNFSWTNTLFLASSVVGAIVGLAVLLNR